MSTAYPAGQPAAATAAPAVAAEVPDDEIRIYGHSNLFYWWPVWVMGFVMAALTYFDGHVMAVVPAGTRVEAGAVVDGQGGPRDVLVAPAGQSLPATGKQAGGQPQLLVAASNNYGVIFVGTVLLIILVTNITVRGLASVIVIALIVITGLLFAQFGLWDEVFRRLGELDVRMNAGGYMAFSLPLFLMWAFTTFIYDHYSYLIITRGQIRIRKEIGDGEVAVDSAGLSLEKKRDDIFRHWMIGLGSGDIRVRAQVAGGLDFEMPNVLFVGWKLNKMQDMLREREVAPQAAGK